MIDKKKSIKITSKISKNNAHLKKMVIPFIGQSVMHLILLDNLHLPDALTRGVSLCRTKTTIVTTVRMIPRLAMQIGKMANTEPCHIY